MVTLTAPYVAGFLAFRETPFLIEALQQLERDKPELLPQVSFCTHIDGSYSLLHKKYVFSLFKGFFSLLPVWIQDQTYAYCTGQKDKLLQCITPPNFRSICHISLCIGLNKQELSTLDISFLNVIETHILGGILQCLRNRKYFGQNQASCFPLPQVCILS